MDFARVVGVRETREPQPGVAIAPGKLFRIGVLQLADTSDAVFRQLRLQRLARAADETHGLVAQESLSFRFADHREAAGLVEFAGQLGEELVVGETNGDRDGDVLLHALRQRRHRLGRAVSVNALCARQIEKGFVQRQRFDQGRQVAHHLADFAAGFGVFAEVRLDDRGLRAKLQRLEHGHGGTHAILAGDIAAGGHHAASSAAHDHRLVQQRRIVALLDGGIERVAIHMRDGKRFEFGMRKDAMAAACAAAFGRLSRVGQTIAAERTHRGSPSGSPSRHSHAAPRTPLESPWRFFTMSVGPSGVKA